MSDIPRCPHGVTDNGSCHRCFAIKLEAMRNLGNDDLATLALQQAARRLDAAYRNGVDAGTILKDGPIGREFDEAYTEWIRARWDAGDQWVRSVWTARP